MGGDRGEELAELLKEVRRIEVVGRRLAAGAVAGGYASVFRGAGLAFEDVREYAEGDDVRSVDWNVTARVGRPHVKKYADERELTMLFLLDLSASMDAGLGALSPRQVAARVCACLALSAARHHDRSGLVAFSGGVDAFVRPARGRDHALRIVRDCLALRGSAPRTDLAPALRFVSRTVRRHAIVFVVSDFLCGGWQEEMARCARRHDVVAVRLLGQELEMPRAGLLRVRDPESGRTVVVDTDSPAVRSDWAATVARWKARTEADLARAKVDLVDVPVPLERSRDVVSGPLVRFFRMRELRGTKR